jgi:hypothetical protein
MKVCIIFRGETIRDYPKAINTFDNVENIKTYILDDLQDNEIEYEIVFVTYENEILSKFQQFYGVKEENIMHCEYISQVDNFNEVNKYVQKNKNQYDRFIILRFDIIYKIKITKWNNFYNNGIIVPNRDKTYDSTLFCNDLIFIIDNTYVDIFNGAVEHMTSVKYNMNKCLHYPSMPHYIGRYLVTNNLPIIYMYEEKYCAYDHPIYAFQRLL